MPILHFDDGKKENLPIGRIKEAIDTGTWFDFKDNIPQVEMVDQHGAVYQLPASKHDVTLAIRQGWSFRDPGEERKDWVRSEYGGSGGELAAGTLGALRGATFGLSDLLLSKTGLVSEADIASFYEANPDASLTGELIGSVGPAILTGGAGAIARGTTKGITEAGLAALPSVEKGMLSQVAGSVPSALSSKVALGIEQRLAQTLATGESAIRRGLGRAASRGIAYGLEGAAYGAGNEIFSQPVLNNEPVTVETLLSGMGLGFAFGGGLGALIPAIGEVIKGEPAILAAEQISAKQLVDTPLLHIAETQKGLSEKDAIKFLDNATGDEIVDMVESWHGKMGGVKVDPRIFAEVSVGGKKVPNGLGDIAMRLDDIVFELEHGMPVKDELFEDLLKTPLSSNLLDNMPGMKKLQDDVQNAIASREKAPVAPKIDLPEQEKNILLNIDNSIKNNSLVKFKYRGSEKEGIRTVEPYEIKQNKDGSFNVFGWCLEKKAIRTFKVKSMNDFEVLPDKFERRFPMKEDAFDASAYIKAGTSDQGALDIIKAQKELVDNQVIYAYELAGVKYPEVAEAGMPERLGRALPVARDVIKADDGLIMPLMSNSQGIDIFGQGQSFYAKKNPLKVGVDPELDWFGWPVEEAADVFDDPTLDRLMSENIANQEKMLKLYETHGRIEHGQQIHEMAGDNVREFYKDPSRLDLLQDSIGPKRFGRDTNESTIWTDLFLGKKLGIGEQAQKERLKTLASASPGAYSEALKALMITNYGISPKNPYEGLLKPLAKFATEHGKNLNPLSTGKAVLYSVGLTQAPILTAIAGALTEPYVLLKGLDMAFKQVGYITQSSIGKWVRDSVGLQSGKLSAAYGREMAVKQLERIKAQDRQILNLSDDQLNQVVAQLENTVNNFDNAAQYQFENMYKHNPELFNHVALMTSNMLAELRSSIPASKNGLLGIVSDKIALSPTQKNIWLQKLSTVVNPLVVLPKIIENRLTPVYAQTLARTYPQLHQMIANSLLDSMEELDKAGKKIPHNVKLMYNILTGNNMTTYVSPKHLATPDPGPVLKSRPNASAIKRMIDNNQTDMDKIQSKG